MVHTEGPPLQIAAFPHVGVAALHIPPHAPPHGAPQGMPPLAQVGAVVVVVVLVVVEAIIVLVVEVVVVVVGVVVVVVGSQTPPVPHTPRQRSRPKPPATQPWS